MPQVDLLTFLPQVFWLIFLFSIFYVLILRNAFFTVYFILFIRSKILHYFLQVKDLLAVENQIIAENYIKYFFKFLNMIFFELSFRAKFIELFLNTKYSAPSVPKMFIFVQNFFTKFGIQQYIYRGLC